MFGRFEGSFWDVKIGGIGMLNSLSTEEMECHVKIIIVSIGPNISRSKQCCYRQIPAVPLPDVQICPPASRFQYPGFRLAILRVAPLKTSIATWERRV